MADAAVELHLRAIDDFGFGRLFWLSNEAVIGANLETERIVLWNPSAERIFGYTAEEAIGMPLDRLVPADLVAAHHAGINRFREMGEPHLVGGPPVEVPAVRKGGEGLSVALTLTAVDEAGGRKHVVAIIRDVTTQKAAEQDRVRAFEAMESFVASASHDLRNPLSAVIGFAQVLLESGDSLRDDQRTDFVRRILSAGEQAGRLVDHLLTTSKIKAGVLDRRPELTSLGTAAQEALAAVGVVGDAAECEGVSVWVDRDHLHRILVNLLANAAKYGRPPICLAGEVRAGNVEIRVSDSGDGVAASFRGALFEPFTRAEASRGQPGTGLGLSIVKGLAEANGGDVRYEDLPAGGACFVVTLPSNGERPGQSWD
jgi:PAS domain S-box-containing protein